MHIQFKLTPPNENDIFNEGCFDSNIGKEIRIQGMVGLLIAAEVIEDGKAVLLTFDLKGVTPMEIISVKDPDNGILWSMGEK